MQDKNYINPFRIWLSEMWKDKKFKRIIYLITGIIISQSTPFICNPKLVFNSSIFITANYICQLIVIITAILFYYPYSRHFDRDFFSAELIKSHTAGEIKLVNLSIGEITDDINNAVEVQKKFTMNVIYIYLTLFAMYSILIVEQFANSDNDILYKTLVTFKILFSAIGISILLHFYYCLTYFRGRKDYIKDNMNMFNAVLGIITLIALIIGIVIIKEREIVEDYFKYLLIFYGVLTGVFFALFSGKLDDGLIGTPFLILIVLYGYAFLQSGFHLFMFKNRDVEFIWIISLALVLKIILSIYFYWLIRSDRIIIYSIFYHGFTNQTKDIRIKCEDILNTIESKKTEKYYKNKEVKKQSS
jgi:hypothetical protein